MLGHDHHASVYVSFPTIIMQACLSEQAEGKPYPESIQKLFTDLLHVAGPGQMHWRYSVRADALLLFLLPPTDAHSAAQVTQHYLRLVLSQLINQRRLGLTGLLYLLQQNDGPLQV